MVSIILTLVLLTPKFKRSRSSVCSVIPMKDFLSVEQDEINNNKFTVHYMKKEVRKCISYEVEDEVSVEEIVSKITYLMVRI